MKKKISFTVLLLPILIVLLGGSSGMAEVGVSKDTIKVGFVGPLSGPAAIVGINGVEGIRLYFKHLNDTGGIHGRKLTLVVEDDGYHPARHLAGVKKMLYRDKVFCFAGNTGTPCIPASIPLIEKEKVPVVAPIATRSKPFIPFERYFFFMALQYDVQARLMVDYIMKDIKAVQPKIAFIGQNDSLGKMGLIGVKESIKKYGLNLVATEWYNRAAVDVSSQVLNLKRADPDYVLMFGIVRRPVLILTGAKKLNWSTQFIACAGTIDPKVPQLAGDAAEGLLGVFDKRLPDSDCVGMVEYRNLTKKYQPKQMQGVTHILGYVSARVLTEGLERAGKNLTREGLIKSLETMTGFDADGMIGPITYNEKERCGLNSGMIFRVKGKKWVELTSWREPTPLN